MSLNLFSTESNKHSYSFEKQYYTRSIEFSDYLRTEFKQTDQLVVIYFLNESNRDSIRDTVSAALPIWLDKVPTAVAGVVYDSRKLEDLLFRTPLRESCDEDPMCANVCGKSSNLTCYLVDEHGIVVLTNSDREHEVIVGKPFYKMNPWLMLQLEMEGLYDLIVAGNKLQDCSKPPMIISGAPTLANFLKFVVRSTALLFYQIMQFGKSIIVNCQVEANMASTLSGYPNTYNSAVKSETKQIEWRIKNSHCFYFGIYSFNIYKWKDHKPNEIKYWCNGTRRYLAGYLKHSNLLMLVVDEEQEVTKCGSIETLAKQRPASWNSRLVKNTTKRNLSRKDYSINRYRKNPEYCHNYYQNESAIFFCKSLAVRYLSHMSVVGLVTTQIVMLSLFKLSYL